MKRIKRTTGIFAITVALAALAAVAGALLWTGGDAQANDPPDGFRYGAVTWASSTVALVQGHQLTGADGVAANAGSPYRVPLHSQYSVTIRGRVDGPNCSITDGVVSGTCPSAPTTTAVVASLSNNVLRLHSAGNTDGTSAIFSAENVGTTTVTFTAAAGGDWADSTLKFDVQVYEPIVRDTDLNMPASVDMNEGETQYIAVNWIGDAANFSPITNSNGRVVLPAAVGVVQANDAIRVTLQGTPGNRLVKIDALEDADFDDETGEYQLYFGGARARWNGKYSIKGDPNRDKTLTVNVTDNDDWNRLPRRLRSLALDKPSRNRKSDHQRHGSRWPDFNRSYYGHRRRR